MSVYGQYRIKKYQCGWEKIVKVNACSTDKSKSKVWTSMYILQARVKQKSFIKWGKSVNTRKVKCTKDEAPSDTSILLIKALGYFKLFECGKKFFDDMDTTY